AAAGHAKAAFSLAAQVDAHVCTDTGRSAAEWSAVAAAGGHAAGRGRTVTADTPASGDPVTLLKRAAREGNLGELKRLLESVPATGAGPDRRTALHEAADGQQAEAARLLIEHGAAVEAKDAAGDTPLLVAARRGAAPVVAVLLEARADADVTDARGGTPLMLAAAAQSPRSVQLLLERGADPKRRNAQGLSALDLAERLGNAPAAQEMVAMLRAHGATGVARATAVREARGDDLFKGWTPAMVAAERGDLAALRAALAAGADVNAADGRGVTALIAAARNGHVPELEALLGAGARPDARAQDGDSALGSALRGRQVAAVKSLLAHHADPNLGQARGDSPLALAAELGLADAVGALVAAGAKPNALDASGRSPLMVAAQRDDAGAVAMLLTAGADPATRDRA
ncbi:MAG: ankyrin repeat domain-containing protein, partial [Proteobacteria bacterium]|nr:ankyrin repeat domain-containing protein [Pseudomonadota bacterium]